METPQVLLDHHLKALRLPTFLREYDKVAQQCAAEGVDYPRYLLRLSEQELLDRERRATERRIKQARFGVVKSLDSFDFLAIPSLNKALVLELARSEFIAELVAYAEQPSKQMPDIVSSKFRSMLIDIFGRSYPEKKFFIVDRDAVARYKARVHHNVDQRDARFVWDWNS